MTTTDLLALADRVEKLTGPDHQIDRMIFAAIYGWSYPLAGAASMEFESETRIHGRTNYTTSLDAALTLVPEGMEFSISNLYSIANAAVGLNLSDDGPFYGESKSGNLSCALTAACLRARASTDKGEA